MSSTSDRNTVRSILSDLRRAIGNTPLYRTRGLSKRPNVEIYLKLEYFNPGGSIKDRTALGMIEAAERDGLLRRGSTIIESSSGNTAIGLAMIAQASGYRVVAICDRHLPASKRARLAAFGARTVFLPETPAGLDTVELRIALANHLAQRVPGAITMGQYSNPANVEVHRRTTGPEIVAALDGQLDMLVAAVGTCGTISGVGQALKQHSPRIRVVGVEPVGSIIFGGCDATYYIQGGGLSFVPPILDRSVIDQGLKVSDRDAIAAAHAFSQREGIMVGGTGGLVLRALRELSGDMQPGQRLVGIIPDAGDRYLDTLFDDTWLHAHGFAGVGQGAAPIHDSLADEVAPVGCSVDQVPASAGPSLDELCERLGIVVPNAVAASRTAV